MFITQNEKEILKIMFADRSKLELKDYYLVEGSWLRNVNHWAPDMFFFK